MISRGLIRMPAIAADNWAMLGCLGTNAIWWVGKSSLKLPVAAWDEGGINLTSTGNFTSQIAFYFQSAATWRMSYMAG